MNVILKSVLLALCLITCDKQQETYNYLREISVTTITNSGHSGSAVIITREIGDKKINFAISSAHVYEPIMQTIIVEDDALKEITIFPKIKALQFKDDLDEPIVTDAYILLIEAEKDLCLLVLDDIVTEESVRFSTERSKVFDEIYHMGSLAGLDGQDSLSTGIISFISRKLENLEVDQTTVPVGKGSSGGGMFVSDGKCIGITIAMAGCSTSFMVPSEHVIDWLETSEFSWLLDVSEETPTIEELNKKHIDNIVKERPINQKETLKETP